MLQTFYPSTREAETDVICEFETSIVYRASSRTVRAKQKSLVFKNQTKPNKMLKASPTTNKN